MERIAKLCGADIELGNSILGLERPGGTCFEASRALLRHIGGIPANGRRGRRETDPQDRGRKFLPTNGGCAYIDLDHLELCLPETLSAWDHVACWRALLRLAQDALEASNRSVPEGRRVQAIANNSDGLGHSYGSHLNFLITRRAWTDLFLRRPHYLAYLAAFQVSSIVFTGQGKVGGENGLPDTPFQISQRADMIETLVGRQTTYRRPLLNTRDEALCGAPGYDGGRAHADRLARLHVIFYDNTLCQVASLLKVGVMQIVLAMLEARRVDPGLALDDPLLALWVWSRDPDLDTPAPLACGAPRTAVQLQLGFLEEARRFVDDGGCEGIVPRAGRILDLWAETLEQLEGKDFDALAGRLDWVLKRSILERVLDEHPRLGWDAPEIKHLDLIYASLDPAEGLFWTYEEAGTLEHVVSETRIEHFRENPPEDTRAWGRAMWLRAVGPEGVRRVDWDRLEVRLPSEAGGGLLTVDMSDPLGSTREAIARSPSPETPARSESPDDARAHAEPRRRRIGHGTE